MPNIVEQRMDSSGVYLRGANGKEVTITTTQILDHYDLEIGTMQQKILGTREWARNGIVFDLGEDMVSLEEIDFDFDPATGVPTLLSIGL